MENAKDKVLLMLVAGMGEADVIAVAVAKLGMTEAQARQAVDDARTRITLTADYKRDEELGIAILQLREIFTKSMAIQDTKVCLAARRELNKLLRLYDKTPKDDSGKLARLLGEIETEKAAIEAAEGATR